MSKKNRREHTFLRSGSFVFKKLSNGFTMSVLTLLANSRWCVAIFAPSSCHDKNAALSLLMYEKDREEEKIKRKEVRKEK